MNAMRQNSSSTRLFLASLVWAGVGATVLSACGPNQGNPVAAATDPKSSDQRSSRAAGVLPSEPSNPQLTVTAISHLMTIESDVVGRATVPALFNVELLVDSNNHFQLLNVHRQGTTRPALPNTGLASASDRARICAENSAASQENCDVDAGQLMKEGVVVERILGRAGVVIKAEPAFSISAGGLLTIHYIESADLNDSAHDHMADYAVRLEQVDGQWVVISGSRPDKGPFSVMKLETSFSGLFATGIRALRVGASRTDLW